MEMIVKGEKFIAKRWCKNGLDRVYINGFDGDVKIFVEPAENGKYYIRTKKGEYFSRSFNQILSDCINDLGKFIDANFGKEYGNFAEAADK